MCLKLKARTFLGWACALAAALGAPLAYVGEASGASSRPQARKQQIVPARTAVDTRSKPLKSDRTKLVPFDTAPFPYRGNVPETGTPFLNVNEDGRRGHRTPFGRLYWESETYSDRRVLLHIPKGFDVRRPSVMVVFFHGHGARLERDVMARQRVPAQITASGANAVLVAPQLAVDAKDSSAGKFWEPGAFGRFVAEAGQKLAKLHGDKRSAKTFAKMPVIVVAYSGGYQAAAWSVDKGGLMKRVRGVVLLDALYGELGKFTRWLENDTTNFFVSAYLGSTQQRNAQLEDMLANRRIAYGNSLDKRIASGAIDIIHAGDGVRHRDLVTHAWTEFPLSDVLKRLPEYQR
jgi:hypothetical protein